MKKFSFTRIISMILCISILVSSLPMGVFAFDSFKVEVTKNDAPIRDGYYATSKVLRKVDKGDTLTVVGEKRNLFSNLWYKVEGGGYIYSENVKKAHDHNVIFLGYGDSHPHYEEFGCKNCDYDSYCSLNTTKVTGCKQCYPHEHNYKLKRYGDAHPHYAEYECSCGSGYCSTEPKKVTGCKQCYPHEHNYKLKRYGDAHPHYAEYECSCGSGYCSTETKKVTGCKECYPHEHDYQFVKYANIHPHYAEYECSCGSGYCSTETKKVTDCKECYPEGDKHIHNYRFLGYMESHPHYAEYECSCQKGYYTSEATKLDECDICYPDYSDVGEFPYIELDQCPADEARSHECNFKFTGGYRYYHPHFALTECYGCGKESYDENRMVERIDCYECFNPQDLYPYKSVNVYKLSSGEVVKLSVQDKNTLLTVADQLHLGFDLCGLAPGPLGMICDGINVAFYILEGDYSNATISGTAFIPFAGIMSTSGKFVNKAGYVLVKNSTNVVGNLAQSKIVSTITNLAPLSKHADTIIKSASKYSDDVLLDIAKISKNDNLSLEKVFVNGKLLISGSYTGTIISPAGLEYVYDSKQNFHRINHILDRHSKSSKSTSSARSFFSISDEEIFNLIDDSYMNRTPVYIKPEGKRTAFAYDIGKVIGDKNQTHLAIVLEGNKVISARPYILGETL